MIVLPPAACAMSPRPSRRVVAMTTVPRCSRAGWASLRRHLLAEHQPRDLALQRPTRPSPARMSSSTHTWYVPGMMSSNVATPSVHVLFASHPRPASI
jgi:hypothetical protein